MNKIKVSKVYDALSEIIDPELGLNFVELGLIYDVNISDGVVTIEYALTSPLCPIASKVDGMMRNTVSKIESVTEVITELVWLPMWSVEMMSEDAKFALGY